MSRNPKIEAVVKAWYEAERAPSAERASKWLHYKSLLESTAQSVGISPDSLESFIFPYLKEYRKQMRAFSAIPQ